MRAHRVLMVVAAAACGGKAARAPVLGNASMGTPAVVAPAGPGPASKAFAASAAKAGFVFTPPAGYRDVAIADNIDVSYDHAMATPGGEIELRWALRAYPADLPPDLRTRQFSWMFFATALFNITRGGNTGEVPDDSEVLPAADFGADDASLTIVHWTSTVGDADAFASGFAAAAVLFIHRDGFGDAYLFIMLRDLDALDRWDRAALGSLRFAAR